MQRRTAVAAASAISMALVSGVIAVAANLGALGFTGASSSPAPAPVPASVAQASPQPVAQTRSYEGGEHENEGREHARTTSAAASAPTGGREHDD